MTKTPEELTEEWKAKKIKNWLVLCQNRRF